MNQTLNFETSESKISGGCDIFTTKPVASDKKLYKTIDRHLESLLQENESYNAAIQQQIELENKRRDPKQAGSDCAEPAEDSPTRNANSFWEQKRRMSVSESPRADTSPLFKSQKLNDQQLKELVSHPLEVPGCKSPSNETSARGVLRRSTSAGSFENNAGSAEQQKRRTSSIGSAANGTKSPILRRSSFNRETINIGPFGPISETASRRTFAYLIGILNASYPDHDFASLKPTDFVKSSRKQLVSKFENSIIALGKQPQEWIWETINAHMDLADCVFYQYNPQESFLDDEPGHLWSLMWFMFNKKRKRVAYFYLSAFRVKNPPSTGGSVALDEYYDSNSKPELREKRRRLTIEHETNDFEGEYDLTYTSSGDGAVEDEDEDMNDAD